MSRAILRWLAEAEIETALIDPGKPVVEGVERVVQLEIPGCLVTQWFQNRQDATVAIEAWRREHNGVRPHSSLGNLTPPESARKLESASAEAAGNNRGGSRLLGIAGPP